jgi:positive regulator of sigma E activity
MNERGIVTRIDGERAEVMGACAPLQCFTCAACSAKEKQQVFRAVNRTGQALHQGDTVEAYVPTGKAIRSAFALLILPLLLFFPFYLAPRLLLANGASEEMMAVSGMAGIAAGILINIGRARWKKTQEMPEIVRILD